MIWNYMKYHTRSLGKKSEDGGGGALAVVGSSGTGILTAAVSWWKMELLLPR